MWRCDGLWLLSNRLTSQLKSQNEGVFGQHSCTLHHRIAITLNRTLLLMYTHTEEITKSCIRVYAWLYTAVLQLCSRQCRALAFRQENPGIYTRLTTVYTTWFTHSITKLLLPSLCPSLNLTTQCISISSHVHSELCSQLVTFPVSSSSRRLTFLKETACSPDELQVATGKPNHSLPPNHLMVYLCLMKWCSTSKAFLRVS